MSLSLLPQNKTEEVCALLMKERTLSIPNIRNTTPHFALRTASIRQGMDYKSVPQGCWPMLPTVVSSSMDVLWVVDHS